MVEFRLVATQNKVKLNNKENVLNFLGLPEDKLTMQLY
jgi:hypothetical protein